MPHEVTCVGFVACLGITLAPVPGPLLSCLEYTMLKNSFLADFFYICIFLHKTQRKRPTQALRGTLESCFLYSAALPSVRDTCEPAATPPGPIHLSLIHPRAPERSINIAGCGRARWMDQATEAARHPAELPSQA